MSGIGGIFNREQRELDPQQLSAMAEALAHRGPDGITVQSVQYAGLLHCMLHDTPESLFETLPAQSLEDRLMITWHGRIDNREELCDTLPWTRPLKTTADSALILAAYEKWGRDCVHHLLGDFSFAIVDSARRTIFCARDHMGIKPFYYFLNSSVFAFASEIKGLFAVNGCDTAINEDRIADYLSCVITENSSTFYKNIFRLPPGHFLEVTPEKQSIEQYWQPHPVKLHCADDAEYREQFHGIFKEAVRCRLRAAYPVGSLLSGGLDSSSIVCMAAGPLRKHLQGPLHTFSGVFDTLTECDEREYFHEIIKRYEVIPHSVPVDEIDPGFAYDATFNYSDEPFFGPHLFMISELASLSARKGVRVLLDGHDGDSAISHGTGVLPEYFLRGRWLRLAQECRAIGNHSFQKSLRMFLKVVRATVSCRIASFLPGGILPGDIPERISFLNPSFVQHNAIHDRLLLAETNKPRFGQNEFSHHRNIIMQPLHPIALELLDKLYIHHNIIGRYPFFDKRVIEYCLSLPSEIKFHNACDRHIMRTSLAEVLPERIRTRRGKTNFASSLLSAFSISRSKWFSFQVDNLHEPTYNYLNKGKFLDLCCQFSDSPSQVTLSDFGFLLRCINLSQWLQSTPEN